MGICTKAAYLLQTSAVAELTSRMPGGAVILLHSSCRTAAVIPAAMPCWPPCACTHTSTPVNACAAQSSTHSSPAAQMECKVGVNATLEVQEHYQMNWI